CQQHNNYPFTF
nr:immunoglobulin light chain junction region [Macaca mulatta]MOV61244.1 immunoglobulin light chain junction region [Macaca mulatta]MOV61337.1 immunoglobulin light chain junction region [Macaca mulatta]MOV61428.1 immunoglobulin light chain junction region [Macaca mulatta]MOV61484.1 immunoglobulin light chain junction region [Macaca mulatta]